MDPDRIDALAHALAAGRSRRGLARLLGAAILAGPLAPPDRAEGAAGKRGRKKKRCPRPTLAGPGRAATCPPPSFCQCHGQDNDPCDPIPVLCGVCCGGLCCFPSEICCGGVCCPEADCCPDDGGRLVCCDARRGRCLRKELSPAETVCCPPPRDCGSSGCCLPNQVCVRSGNRRQCCEASRACPGDAAGHLCCPEGQVCVEVGGRKGCCDARRACPGEANGRGCCPEGTACGTLEDGTKHCLRTGCSLRADAAARAAARPCRPACPAGQECCDGICCPPGEECGADLRCRVRCEPDRERCCGTTHDGFSCCRDQETCCDGICCPPGEECGPDLRCRIRCEPDRERCDGAQGSSCCTAEQACCDGFCCPPGERCGPDRRCQRG